MGTTVDLVRVASARWRHRASALGLADAAVRHCLHDAGIAAGDVDLLVNAGLYRDRNLGEPALAALIQADVHMNGEDPHPGRHGTFSFDLANGTCGPLTALQVVDGFLRAGTIGCAVVVASDANPGRRLAPGFPFTAAGAAAVCRWHEGDAGFGPFRWLTRGDDADSFRSMVRLEGGRNLLRVSVDPSFVVRAAGAAAKVADEVLADASIAPGDLPLAVVAPGGDAFVEAFADRTGIPADRVVAAPDPHLHTASFLVALADAVRGGRLPPGSTALFAAAAAGITAGAVLYRA